MYAAGKGRIIVLYPQRHILANKFAYRVSYKGARKHTRFAQDLKSVAYSNYDSAALSVRAYSVHDWRKTGHGAGAQIVAVGEAAWYNHYIEACKTRVLVPHIFNRAAQYVPDHKKSILIAV